MTSALQTVHRMRGCAVGALSACTAVAAHGMADGVLPDSGSLVLMIAACAALGATVGTAVRRSPGPAATLGLLAAGQVLAHLCLSALDDLPAMLHHGVAPASPFMIAMHVAATGVTAGAVRVAEAVLPALLTAIVALVHPVLDPPAAECPRLDRLVPARDARRDRHTIAPLGTRGPPVMAR
ncbi:hypothetical protein [Gordonia paraffinivorans]|uniref:hypothetical protein n=1 Tax=Gordonia paraffinivorans TaxID=175628 RepID=UPI0024324075|nr:hypothetical protein [Gordonia paraffinivorans]